MSASRIQKTRGMSHAHRDRTIGKTVRVRGTKRAWGDGQLPCPGQHSLTKGKQGKTNKKKKRVTSEVDSISRSKSASCRRNETMDEAASKAERIRASQGFHETEVSCTGEAGLQQCLLRCQKNPGHQNFIPTNSFNIEHLSHRYCDKDIVDWVRATSDVTCRLSVRIISGDRPKTWPGSDKPYPFSAYKGKTFIMAGTGWVNDVEKFTEKDNRNCECEECCRPGTHTPKKTWGNVLINTACHVVCNDEEARHTKCHFFFDSHETDINKVLTLTGLKLLSFSIEGDWSEMGYATHNLELLDIFEKMRHRWDDLRKKVSSKHESNKNPRICDPDLGYDDDMDVNHDLCISKQVSVGIWTQRHLVDKDDAEESTTYRYNTPTCPGSSGAPVITLAKENMGTVWLVPPPHSQGCPGNDNNSGVGFQEI